MNGPGVASAGRCNRFSSFRFSLSTRELLFLGGVGGIRRARWARGLTPTPFEEATDDRRIEGLARLDVGRRLCSRRVVPRVVQGPPERGARGAHVRTLLRVPRLRGQIVRPLDPAL